MLKAIIVDNEKPAIDILKILLERTGMVSVSESFATAADALSRFQSLSPDVAFLDIELPEIKGLELAEKLLAINEDVEIIFVTAYDQYALEAFGVNALDYLLKPLSFEAVARTVSRLARRKRLPSAQGHDLLYGRIYCLGKLSVYGPAGEHPAKWRTSKAEELFAFMLHNLEREIPKWKICEALWPECDIEKVDVYLHTTLYKMKKVLTAAKIEYDIKFINGCYRMSLPQTFIDVIEFDSIASSNINIEEAAIDKCERALSLYKGDYLEDNDYLWSLSKKEEYSKAYFRLATSVAKYYMRRNDYSAAEKILQNILERFPLSEAAHELFLKLYFAKKDRAAFVTHYNTVKELFKTELGIEPSSSLQALYSSILCS